MGQIGHLTVEKHQTEKAPWSFRLRELLAIAVIFTLAGIIAYQHFSTRWTTDRFHKLFYTAADTWQTNKWLGLSTWQNPNDIWITQEIITEVKPDVIVETGTHRGGSALIWAMVLAQVNPEARVITIDIEDKTEDARKIPLFRDKVDFLLGSSTAPEIVAEVKKRIQGKKVMVLFDSDHHKPHVLEELRLYSPLVSVGSYLIVQDTNINGHPVYALDDENKGPGPMEALDEFLAGNDQFVSDRSRERLLFTLCPKGYLKRVK